MMNRAIQLPVRMQEMIRSGALPHAFILEGPATANKLEVALRFAQAVLCPEQPGIGCGTCPVCCSIQDENHLNVIHIRATTSKGTQNRSVKDEDIQYLQKRLMTHPEAGQRNVAIIQDIDTATMRALNRLLKTLEEPPEGTVMLLLSENAQQLPQTIRSRAVLFRLSEELQHADAAIQMTAQRKADTMKALLDRKAPYYMLKKKIDSWVRKKETSRMEIEMVLDCLEQSYRSDMIEANDRNAQQEAIAAIDAVECARRELKSGFNRGYLLKDMALSIEYQVSKTGDA